LILVVGLLTMAASVCAGSATVELQGFQPSGWQVGYPYSITVNSGSFTAVMCDDYAHGGEPGDRWQANFTNLGTADLSQLRFNQLPGASTLYDEAGWLLLQTLVTPQYDVNGHNQWTDINWAAWAIFDSSVLPLLTPKQEDWLDAAQTEASNGFPGVNFHQVGIYTPADQYDSNLNNPQELMTIVPEPSTVALLGVGIIGILRSKRFC